MHTGLSTRAPVRVPNTIVCNNCAAANPRVSETSAKHSLGHLNRVQTIKRLIVPTGALSVANAPRTIAFLKRTLQRTKSEMSSFFQFFLFFNHLTYGDNITRVTRSDGGSSAEPATPSTATPC